MKQTRLIGMLVSAMLVIFGSLLLFVSVTSGHICISLTAMLAGLVLWIAFEHIDSVIKHSFASLFVVIVFIRDIVAIIFHGYRKVRRIRQRTGSYTKIYATICRRFDEKLYGYVGKYERR